MYLYKTTAREVGDILTNLDNKSSSGVDDISNILIKLSSDVINPYLVFLINFSFDKGIFPKELARARVLPLHKEGSKLDQNNYRPISLLVVFSKIFERAMYNRVYQYLGKFSLFYKKQLGFRSKHSTIDALVELTETVCMRQQHSTIVSFVLDLKKAFDTINHTFLLEKLERYGIRGNCWNWFNSYLSNRMQQVVINDTSSDWCEIKNGVPQGSILGPLLFLIYINDLPLVCKNVEVLLFADDTNIEAVGCSVENIKSDLDSINFWLESTKLVLNLSKTIQLHLKKGPENLSFQLNKTDIKVEHYCKYLGVKIDKFSFRDHIDHVQSKLSKQCGILEKLRHYVPRNQLISYYNSNVTPLIQYGALVYGCCTYSALLPIYLLQKKNFKSNIF